ncbi:MAG: hypothetical protein KAJ48_11225, partial [Elusimicrobiales bacterium]|nr:hypothetical protein [Elusimicrobiales bacterium]
MISVENGSAILEHRWIEFTKGKNKFKLDIKPEMSPNAYVSVTLIQPHQDKKNDRPIRLYGVIPLSVKNPSTVLSPVIKTDDEWQPETEVSFSVSESKNRAMTYTVAIVDEGLLGLTNFKTPDLHSYFYKKEALGVKTWDLYDFVVGAYGANLERLLALGGGADLGLEKQEKERRFPPVVKFLGPFKLGAKKTKTHTIKLPPYVGAVKIMVVAGRNGAYGNAEKSVFVKEALTLLATLPRVIGPDEEMTVPVSIFSSEKSIKDVNITIKTDESFNVVGKNSFIARFSNPGEEMGFFKIKACSTIGSGKIRIFAESGAFKTRTETSLKIRSPNPSTLHQFNAEVKQGSFWKQMIIPHGLRGTNEVSLEVSAVPPLNLEKRLGYLIRYPHGCVEQVTSSVFPQLYISNIVKLDDERKKEIETNVNAGIDRLRSFQIADGGFSYWPGGSGANAWATNYAGHFLVEAKKKGYYVPPKMLEDWLNYQKTQSQTWNPERNRDSLNQAYRVYVLALAGSPEMGAMNRLRESKKMSDTALWQLAAAYKLAGITDAADEIADKTKMKTNDYKIPGNTFGSQLRDKGI